MLVDYVILNNIYNILLDYELGIITKENKIKSLEEVLNQ